MIQPPKYFETEYAGYGELLSQCWECETPIPDDSNLARYLWTGETKRRIKVTFARVCAQCFSMECEVVDAQVSGRRFAKIDVRSRCPCGRTSLPSLGECVTCWREIRMLNKRQAELRFVNRLITNLKREARGDENRRAA